MHISKFKPGTVEKNSSTIGPPAGIEPTPLAMPVQCVSHTLIAPALVSYLRS